MKTILCTGEMLIDFLADEINVNLAQQCIFHKKPGGAPANVACVIGALGGKSAIFAAVGKDPFGDCLETTLQRFHVDTKALVRTAVPTTLAFVSIFENGARDFVFNRGADAVLKLNDLPKATEQDAAIYHFGAATAFLEGELKHTYTALLESAVKSNKLISFDPNYRSAFWANDLHTFRAAVMPFIKASHFVKFSDEEAMLIFSCETLEVAIENIKNTFSGTVAVTLGSKGTRVFTPHWDVIIPAPKVNAIDTTGAGDAFVGAVLYALSQLDEPKLALEDRITMSKIVESANGTAAKVCTAMGALTALEGVNDVAV